MTSATWHWGVPAPKPGKRFGVLLLPPRLCPLCCSRVLRGQLQPYLCLAQQPKLQKRLKLQRAEGNKKQIKAKQRAETIFKI